jgi:hypothetical protein
VNGGYLAEEYGVGAVILWNIKMSAEWILKCVSFPLSEDASFAGQIVRRARNGEVQDALYK